MVIVNFGILYQTKLLLVLSRKFNYLILNFITMKKNVCLMLLTLTFVGLTNAQNLRANFLKGKMHQEVVNNYNSLPFDQKNVLWLEKIEQLLNQNLPAANKNLLVQLRDNMRNSNAKTDTKEFRKISLELAKVTPLEDLSIMFESLQDYTFTGTFSGSTPIPQNTLNDIESINTFDVDFVNARKKTPCTCRWCAGGNPGHDCTPTTSGCGWLWNNACTGCLARL